MAGYPEKYCDLVMKGGVTSGVVYPNAVLELAKTYRFKSIGGTSAGAIAAVVTAAASLGDRRQHVGEDIGQTAGFPGMVEVARLLSGAGFIYGLFQPATGAVNAFRLVVLLAGPARFWRKASGILVAVLAIAPLEFLAIMAVLCGFGYYLEGWAGVKAALMPALFCAYGGAGTCAALRVARVARRNLMGLCSGMRGPRTWPWWGRRPLALTEWLHQTVQVLAGKPDDEPVTFGDLRDAPRYDNEPTSGFSINLQVITTGISHREPRTLPFANKNFWFREREFARLFPESVVRWMVEHADGAPLVVDGETYHRLPEGSDFPVLVAARMSLSFPLLISAVPLYEPASWERLPASDARPGGAEDRDEALLTASDGHEHTVLETMEGLASGGGRRTADVTEMRVCWFSDGGISSNFPIHLFDAGLPLWPTFAINLRYPSRRGDVRQASPGRLEDAVFLPESNNQGWKHDHHPIASSWALKEVAGFLFGVIGTMQNWRDLLQSRAPGHRDRVVHVSLQGAEGGMNLDMPATVLDCISKKGTIAGQRFAGFSFENHYWVRWRNFSAAVHRYTVEFADNTMPERWLPPYAEACASPLRDEDPPSYPFKSAAAGRRAREIHRKLHAQGRRWKGEPDLSKGAPNPAPQLRITPTY